MIFYFKKCMKLKKLINFQSIILIILPTIATYLLHSFLVTSYIYYLILIIISLLITLLIRFKIMHLFDKSLFVTFLVVCCLIYDVFLSGLLVYSKYNKSEFYIVKMKGYTLSRIDEIFFKFHNKIFSRRYNLNNYNVKELKDNYNIKLELKQPLRNIYYIESINLIYKNTENKKIKHETYNNNNSFVNRNKSI
jgi:hypothetical protein